MRVAFLSNKTNVWLRRAGKDILSNFYLLLQQKKRPATLILPEYDYIPAVLDPSATEFSIFHPPEIDKLREYDLLIWEWGWGIEGPRVIQEIRKQSNIPILMFPGPLDRFWREVSLDIAHEHLQAARLVNFVGVMLEDTVDFYQTLLPHAKVFHLPVPVDTTLFKSFALSSDERKPWILLSAPTLFQGAASQVPISTYVAFRELLSESSNLRGIAFTYHDEEEKDAQLIFSALGVSQAIDLHNFVRPIFRYFELARSCKIALFLPHSLIQGRTAIVCACLGIPFVGSSEIETHRRLFPTTSVPWTSPKAASRIARQLINDHGYAETVSENASQAVEYYSVEKCRTRMRNGIGMS